MKGRNWKQAALTALSLVLVAGMMGNGCPADPNINGNGGGGGDGGGGDGGGDGAVPFTIVKTDIDVRHDAAIRAGNDLVVYGTGVNTGVSYLVPSESPTAGTPVPNSDHYDSGAFAVGSASNYIFLVGSNTGPLAFQVSVFDLATETITKTFTPGEIRLGYTPASEEDAGNIQASGQYCVVICDANTVTDGKIMKFIDAAQNPPTVTSFGTNPTASAFNVEQCAIDATSKKVVAVVDDTFYVYDMDNPNAAPTQIVSPNGINDTYQIAMHNNWILAIDNQGYPLAFLVNLNTNTIVNLTDAEAIFAGAIGDEVFAFWADATAEDSSGGGQRAAVGTIPGPGSTKAALDQYIDGSTTNNGSVGFGQSMCITPNSDYMFLSDGYLQFSLGNASFVVPPDPNGEDAYGTPAWDVHCTNYTVAFKTASDRGLNTTTKVGYIILP